REALAKGGPHDDAYFALLDDLGAGLEHLKDYHESIRVMRDKLHEQEGLGQKDRQLYTSYANLGTFIIHAAAPKARTGDEGARDQLWEGIIFLRKAIAVNPQAHFGREIWQ